jgi:hypothetical protein
MDNIRQFFSHPVACLIEGFSIGVGLGWYACEVRMKAEQDEIKRENK